MNRPQPPVPKHWTRAFPVLQHATPELATLAQQLQEVTLPADTTVFQPGSACTHYLMVLSGSVKVTLTSVTGREVVLYRVCPGETCILTTSCLLASENYSASGTTESPVTALLLSHAHFNNAVAHCDHFRSFVFSGLGHRFSELINRIDQVNFGTIDARLAEALLAAGHGSPTLHITHQALATELGTAREVVSRHLKTFARNQWVELGRGHITILDAQALKQLLANTWQAEARA